MRILLHGGADVNSADDEARGACSLWVTLAAIPLASLPALVAPQGVTILMDAAMHARLDEMQILLEAGCNINQADAVRRSAPFNLICMQAQSSERVLSLKPM